MAKIWVVDASDNTRVPFLRGILTRSLTDAGLAFEDAYRVSSAIRQHLGELDEISTEALRKRVVEYLNEELGEAACQRYKSAPLSESGVMVLDSAGRQGAFSRSVHLRCLESSGLAEDKAASVSTAILQHLIANDVSDITSAELGRLTYDYLRQHIDPKAAQRYLVWVDHLHSGRPLVLMIGGSTGSGKSTIATEAAHRLGIVRTQSTDMLREVMRMMIPQRLLPVLHASSFNAGDLLPGASLADEDSDQQLEDGYLTQSELLGVTCEAVVQRALRERVSLILEGVHVHPALLDRLRDNESNGAVVIMLMLAVIKREKLKARLSGRLGEAPQRAGSGHLDSFDRIWRLQTFLLSEADRAGIPILENDDKTHVTDQLMRTIVEVLAEHCDRTPQQVFSKEERGVLSSSENRME
jgi:2-phosphoglycerate kinase